MSQIQGTLLGREEKKLTFVGLDGKITYAYAAGECSPTLNTVYNFTIEEKTSAAGKQYKVVTGMTDANGTVVPMAAQKKGNWGGKGGGGKYDSEGAARGNCRAVTTEYIVSCIAKGIAPNIPEFVALLKQSEGLMLPKKAVTFVTPPVVQPTVPAVAENTQVAPVAPAVTPVAPIVATPNQPLI